MRTASLFTVGLTVAALAALSACQQKTADSGATTTGATEVLFGTAGPVSGGIAHIGKDVENGVRMALDEINATKPQIGGKTVTFKIVAEDDAGEPKQATAVAQKLCDTHVVAVVGHLQSGTSIPASGIYHQCGLPMITAAATNPDLTKPGYNNVFRLIANDNQLGAAVVDYAAKAGGVKKIAIVDDRTALGQGLASVFKETAAKHGIEVVDQQFTNDKAADFMAILTAIKSKQPDAILYGGLDAQAGPMLRQMQQLGMGQVKMFGGDAICTEKLPELAGGGAAVVNVVCATGGASVQKMQGGPQWLTQYEAKYPKEFQIYSPYAYDATRVLVEAMKQAGSTDPKVYLPKLSAIQMTGLTGPIAFTANGELTQPAVTLYTYKDGKRVEIP